MKNWFAVEVRVVCYSCSFRRGCSQHVGGTRCTGNSYVSRHVLVYLLVKSWQLIVDQLRRRRPRRRGW